MADQSIDQLVAILKYLNSWKPIEIGLQGTGASKLRDGGYMLDAEIFVTAIVPNDEAVTKARRLLLGEEAEVAERNPVTQGEQLVLGRDGDLTNGVEPVQNEAVKPPF